MLKRGLLFVFLLASIFLFFSTAISQQDVGLQIQSSVILDSLQAPPFEELKRLGITYLGTNIYYDFAPDLWEILRNWNHKAHLFKFKTYAFINDLDHASSLTVTAVKNGFDAIELDEMISTYSITQRQLLDIISATREVKTATEFIITEWKKDAIKQAFEWASKISNTRVASSDYNNLSTIDYLSSLQQQYKVKAIVWLIFIYDPVHDWVCYNNLQEWIKHAKSLKVDIFLWCVDAKGSWKEKWGIVKSSLV